MDGRLLTLTNGNRNNNNGGESSDSQSASGVSDDQCMYVVSLAGELLKVTLYSCFMSHVLVERIQEISKYDFLAINFKDLRQQGYK